MYPSNKVKRKNSGRALDVPRRLHPDSPVTPYPTSPPWFFSAPIPLLASNDHYLMRKSKLNYFIPFETLLEPAARLAASWTLLILKLKPCLPGAYSWGPTDWKCKWNQMNTWQRQHRGWDLWLSLPISYLSPTLLHSIFCYIIFLV